MSRISENLWQEFTGDVVRHTEGATVFCMADPDLGKVEFGPHNCHVKLGPGDRVIVHSEIDPEYDDEEWFQKYRFCSNCKKARHLPESWRRRGIEQVIVEGPLEQFEGQVEGRTYDDAVRMTDVEVLAYSDPSEGG